jgi:hypothetical protein
MNLCTVDIISECSGKDPSGQRACRFFKQSMFGGCMYFYAEMDHCDNLDAQTEARRPEERREVEQEFKWTAKSYWN